MIYHAWEQLIHIEMWLKEVNKHHKNHYLRGIVITNVLKLNNFSSIWFLHIYTLIIIYFNFYQVQLSFCKPKLVEP